MNWKDPARAAHLAKLWNEGHSAGTIARMMGCVSRNSVIGAVRRAGLPFRATSTRTPHPTRKHPISREAANRRPNASKHPWRSEPKPISPAAEIIKAIKRDGLPLPPPAATDIPRISFAALNEDGHRHCRWPCLDDVKDTPTDVPMFCGAQPFTGLPYCLDHAKRAYAPPPPRRRELPIVAGNEVVAA